MKKTIAIALAAMALTSFGSQQTQAAEARARHILEVARERVERINREGARTARVERISFQEAIAIQSKAFYKYQEDIARQQEALRRRFRLETGFKASAGFSHNSPQTPTEVKQKKPRNSLRSNDPRCGNRNLNQRKFKLSEPARRRK